MEKTNVNFTHDSLDKFLGLNENREINPYFKTYKYNTLIVGTTASGKSTYLLNMIMQNIYPFHKLYLFVPDETINSGIMAKFIERSQNSPKMKDKIVLYNISEHKTPVFEYFSSEREKYEQKVGSKNAMKDLFVFDDFIFATTKSEKNFVNRLLVNSSRLSSDVVLLVQSIKDFPPSIFGNIQVFILFYQTVPASQVDAILTRTNVVTSRKQKNKLFKYLEGIETKDPIKEPLTIVTNAPIKYKLTYNNYYIPKDVFDE